MRATDAEPIDAVVTWVDGEDEAWRASLRRFAGHEDDPQKSADGPRYRDHGLLRYCLRSLRANMPWLRRIHLVTEGHLPRWLDACAGHIAVVRHDAIFQDRRWLPVFNSRAIETCLHRIPGLSETFIYFNDDFFVLRPAERALFVSPDGGHIVPIEDGAMPTSLTRSHANDRSLAFTQLLLNKKLGVQHGRRIIPHVGYVLSRGWIEHLWSVWPEDLARTAAHRFCMTDSVSLQALYYYSLLEWPRHALPECVQGRAYPVRLFVRPEYRLVMTVQGTAGLKRDIAAIDGAATRFLCINDDTVDPRRAAEEAALTRSWLDRRFPEPAPWEAAPATEG